MNNTVWAVIIIAIVVTGGGYMWFQNQQKAGSMQADTQQMRERATTTVPATAVPQTTDTSPQTTVKETQSNQTGSAPTTPTGNSMTMAVVATHNSAASCWSAINGSVYDLTAWIAKHPGGEQAIKQLCGKDGTSLFNNKHGGQERQESTLASFKIGALAQ